jgi:protein phosphatase
MQRSGLWDRLETNWICLDAEIMPWSAKAQELLRTQYAPTGASARASIGAAIKALGPARGRNDGSKDLLARYEARLNDIDRYVEAYRRYCWLVEKVDDLKIAPFHLLATEGRTHTNRDHPWHMEVLAELCRADEDLLRPTAHRMIDVTDTASEQEGIAWWDDITAGGAEGMVVKPLAWVTRGRRGLAQPAIKCRGREYLRIIYGPEYTAPEHLERLRSRGLSHKRSLALREYALGLEALSRFTEGEPLYRVHECVFGVLALESEPVDPRL